VGDQPLALGDRLLVQMERVHPVGGALAEAARAPEQLPAVSDEEASPAKTEHVGDPVGLGFPEIQGRDGSINVDLVVKKEDLPLREIDLFGRFKKGLPGDMVRLQIKEGVQVAAMDETRIVRRWERGRGRERKGVDP
jgi:hypothetical protein